MRTKPPLLIISQGDLWLCYALMIIYPTFQVHKGGKHFHFVLITRGISTCFQPLPVLPYVTRSNETLVHSVPFFFQHWPKSVFSSSWRSLGGIVASLQNTSIRFPPTQSKRTHNPEVKYFNRPLLMNSHRLPIKHWNYFALNVSNFV